MKAPDVLQKPFYFWGRGKKVPERVIHRAARYVQKQYDLSASPAEIAPHVRFSQILHAGFRYRHWIAIKVVFFSALTGEVAGNKEGVRRTIDLISKNTDIYLIQGKLKGAGSISAEALNIINEECTKVGFVYVINENKIGITTQPGIGRAELEEVLTSIQRKIPGIEFELQSVLEIVEDCGAQLLSKGPLGLYHEIMRMLDSR